MRGHGLCLKSDMVFDFLDIKPIVRRLCDSLDHRLLLPGENPHLSIEKKGGNYQIRPPDGSFFSIPCQDVIVMPLTNTSVERLASFLACEIRQAVWKKFDFMFEKMEVEVEETPGQSATFVWEK